MEYIRTHAIRLLLSLFVGLSACNSKPATSEETVFEIEANKETISDISNIIESIQVLELPNPGESFIGEINKIVVSKDRLYILDSRRAKSLFIYNLNGGFIHAIDNIGRGPGEFLAPTYFDVDVDKNEILLLDNITRKLIVYDLAGKYVSEIALPHVVNSFIALDEENILLDCGNNTFGVEGNYRLAIFDRHAGNIKSHFFEIPKEMENVNHLAYSPLSLLNDTILYQPPASNIFYSVTGETVSEKYEFDFGNRWPSSSYFSTIKNSAHPMEVVSTMSDEGYVMFLNILEAEEHVLVHYYCRDQKYMAVIDKNNGGCAQVKLQGNTTGHPVGVHQDEFIFEKTSDKGDISILFIRFKDMPK